MLMKKLIEYYLVGKKLGNIDRLDRHMKIFWMSCTARGCFTVRDCNNLFGQKHMKVGQRGQVRE